MQPESFFHVALKVPDLEEALAFYREYFDATVIERGEAASGEGATAVNHVVLTIADKHVYLFDEAPYEAAGILEDVPTGFLHFGVVVADVEAAYEALREAGIDFIMRPSEFGSLKIAFFRDPAGVRVELLEHL